MVSSQDFPFHGAFLQVLHPLTLSFIGILPDRRRCYLPDDSPAPPIPDLPRHHRSSQVLGLGLQLRSGSGPLPAPTPTNHSPCPFHYSVLHSRRMLWFLRANRGTSRKTDPECIGGCAGQRGLTWVCRIRGERRVTNFTFTTPHLTQLPPQPFKGETRECFCL